MYVPDLPRQGYQDLLDALKDEWPVLTPEEEAVLDDVIQQFGNLGESVRLARVSVEKLDQPDSRDP